jgi:hypothetical protein
MRPKNKNKKQQKAREKSSKKQLEYFCGVIDFPADSDYNE